VAAGKGGEDAEDIGEQSSDDCGGGTGGTAAVPLLDQTPKFGSKGEFQLADCGQTEEEDMVEHVSCGQEPGLSPEEAVRRIQMGWRRVQRRAQRQRAAAAVEVQAVIRTYLAAARWSRVREASGVIRRCWRRQLGRRARHLLRQEYSSAATTLQRAWRRCCCRANARGAVKRRQRAGALLTAYTRGWLLRRHMAALTIQRVVKGSMGRTHVAQMRLAQQHLATRLWAARRAQQLKQGCGRRRRACTVVERWWLGVLAVRQLVSLRREKAATKIAKSWRCRQLRCRVGKRTAACLTIQSHWRGAKGRWLLQSLLGLRRAMSMIWRCWRAHQLRCVVGSRTRAARVIQRCSRAYLASRMWETFLDDLQPSPKRSPIRSPPKVMHPPAPCDWAPQDGSLWIGTMSATEARLMDQARFFLQGSGRSSPKPSPKRVYTSVAAAAMHQRPAAQPSSAPVYQAGDVGGAREHCTVNDENLRAVCGQFIAEREVMEDPVVVGKREQKDSPEREVAPAPGPAREPEEEEQPEAPQPELMATHALEPPPAKATSPPAQPTAAPSADHSAVGENAEQEPATGEDDGAAGAVTQGAAAVVEQGTTGGAAETQSQQPVAWDCAGCGFRNEASPDFCVMCEKAREPTPAENPAPHSHRSNRSDRPNSARSDRSARSGSRPPSAARGGREAADKPPRSRPSSASRRDAEAAVTGAGRQRGSRPSSASRRDGTDQAGVERVKKPRPGSASRRDGEGAADGAGRQRGSRPSSASRHGGGAGEGTGGQPDTRKQAAEPSPARELPPAPAPKRVPKASMPWNCAGCGFTNEVSPLSCVMCDAARD